MSKTATKRPVPPSPPKKAPPAPPRSTPKSFTIKKWTGEDEGEKAIFYGRSGAGKTTLASMLPDAVFIGADDGGRKIRNPHTGEPVMVVEGIGSFSDVRDALHSRIFQDYQSIVVDTLTMVEQWGEQWTMETVKSGQSQVKNLEEYGYGKGYRHLMDTMRLLQQDFDPHVRAGRNVILLCQESTVNIANPEGLNYIEAGPKLTHNNQASVRLSFIEWCDHVLRIGHENAVVRADPADKKPSKGKIQGDDTRAIFVHGAPHFVAKSRTINERVVSFADPSDDSIWTYMFGEDE